MIQLLRIVREHYSALASDLRERYGISVDDLARTVSWRESLALVTVLVGDMTSRLAASMNGWGFHMTRLEMLTQIQINAQLHARDRLPFPWDSPGRPDVTASERAALEAQLEARSAIRPQ